MDKYQLLDNLDRMLWHQTMTHEICQETLKKAISVIHISDPEDPIYRDKNSD